MLFSRGWEFAVLVVGMTGLWAATAEPLAAVEPAVSAMERPALLNDAFNALLEHQGRWAYTETNTGVIDGKPLGESSFRVDPSAPYPEQNKPLKIAGKIPTEKQLKRAAERAERAAKQRLEQQEKLPTEPLSEDTPKVHRADEVHLWVSGQKVTPEIDRAKCVKEDETSVTYEVLMHPDGKGDANAILDKFELTARVNKITHQFERATIRQRASLRVKLIARVSEALLEFEFSTPDPRYPPVLTKATADGRVKVFFGKDHVIHNEMVRTELRHVTPYDERFGVKIGPVRTLEF